MSKRIKEGGVVPPHFAPHHGRNYPSALVNGCRQVFASFLFLSLLCLTTHGLAAAQSSEHILFGDLKVDESNAGEKVPFSFEILLYTLSGGIISRQTVTNNGRYRFMGLANGHYDVAVEVENREVARVRVNVSAPYKTDFRQDLNLEWSGGAGKERTQTVSAQDFYQRAPANKSLFEKAQQAMDKKKYEEGAALLKQLLAADGKDFQAWSELGTAYLLLDKQAEAEKAYARAAEEKPTFFLALLNLGRVRAAQKKYEEAIEPLARAVEVQPASADANFLLGEAYLQTKKGSKAVGYLGEAARLGRADAHLRLATLYNAAGMKDRAAAEYEQFLSKKPDHPDRKKLEQYIKENKK
ncbi:MAG: tetratricopeptide repeat protein [Rubrivivax sp.]|nr:tetratricopeptide repeat protein [Pyrinomonadaceae bacterium]